MPKYVTKSLEIPLRPFWAKLFLFLRAKVVCKGYGEDYKNFTQLVWPDDKDLDFYDRMAYPEFQLWIDIRIPVPSWL